MSKMVLIACEESQAVCKAFRDIGWDAYSCDLQKCSGGHPEWHIVGDVTTVLYPPCLFATQDTVIHQVISWDLIIAHPPCTYLSKAGSNRLYVGSKYIDRERYEKGLAGRDFFMMFYNLGLSGQRMCIENPIPNKIYNLPSPSQIIQPYQFGHPFSKATLLWEFGLPPLYPTDVLYHHTCYTSSVSGGKLRSKTFPGIAQAMADQWGCLDG